jgi:ligand-binding sensor domain-containing protein|tara:strand:- start:1692 stop:2639 length:948 start_codon:yes stop_codon:yes gene_type:complete
MAKLYAGTVGWGVWVSDDLGESWDFAFKGLYTECRIWALSSHDREAGVVWAGSDRGLLRQDPDGNAVHVPSPADDASIWAVAQSPSDPNTILIGTHPGALYRSDDGGDSFRQLPIELVDSCPFIGKPRVTRIRFDPIDEDTIWVSVEIDAIHRSRDGGKSWVKLDNGFRFPDIHDLAVIDDNGRKLLAATAVGLYLSDDDGDTWTWHKLDSEWQYCRGIKPKADDSAVVFLCNGDGPPGSEGILWRSDDHGESWQDANLGPTNSTPWMVATHPEDPDLIFCCTNLGQIFRSTDGGDRWQKLARELGEIRTLLWHP